MSVRLDAFLRARQRPVATLYLPRPFDVRRQLYHLEIEEAPKRSSLAYANEHRSWELYRRLFFLLLERCPSRSFKKKLRFKNKLVRLDSTVIDLCVSSLWAKFSRTKGAIKLHLV